MQPFFTNSVRKTICAAAILAGVAIPATNASCATATDFMPATQQNALVEKYCAVCHTDAFPNGRLSLQHFDAAHADPGVAAMIASKLRNKALGASGQPLPDRVTQDALLGAIEAEATGAKAWVLSETRVSEIPVVTASFVQDAPTGRGEKDPDLYRVILTCRAGERSPGILLTWSPNVPKDGQEISVAVDGKPVLQYTMEGDEKMGNGQAGTSGPGGATLPVTVLPAKTLTVTDLFPGVTVEFPFEGLTQSARKSLASCFEGR